MGQPGERQHHAVLGYDAVARITKHTLEADTTPRDAAIALGLLTGDEYDRIVDLP